jgi:triacylglycerol lipase
MIIIDLIAEYILIFKNRLYGIFLSIPENYKNGQKGDIVFIIGFDENWYFLNAVAKHMNNKGYRIHFPAFNTRSPITVCTSDILKYVEDNNLNNIILITHSKGGLIARSLLSKIDIKIQSVIEISSPNHGTIFGYLHFLNLKELKPKSDQVLISEHIQRHKIINIFPKFDNHVLPNSSLYLDGAKNIKINIVGHTRILESKELLTELDKII